MKVIADPILKRSDLGKWPVIALAATVVGVLICLVLGLQDHDRFFRAYLVGYMYWFNIGMGSLLLLMIQHLSGGAWGVAIRRVLESSANNIKWMLLFFIPVLLGMHSLYEWTHEDVVAKDAIIQLKVAWLNIPFFLIRVAIYFGLWVLIAFLLKRWSTEQDATANPLIPGRMRNLCGPGIVIFFLTMTFAAVDWILSLEVHYYSTMFGPVVMIGQALVSMAFTIAILVLLSRIPPMNNILTPGHFHDLGKLMLAFTMLWAYINFSQFLITWSANLVEEIPYYLKRMSGGWGWVGAGLIAFHFFVPFCALLNRDLKRNPRTLIWVAIWVICVRFVDLSYLILPSAHNHHVEGPESHFTGHFDGRAVLLALGSVLAIGGIWLTLFFRTLISRPMIPINDPYLQEALEFHGGH
ncbi:MAG: hypothetical protein ACR2IE_18075 [Candidatus Sumerlaeaceae bacterium]